MGKKCLLSHYMLYKHALHARKKRSMKALMTYTDDFDDDS